MKKYIGVKQISAKPMTMGEAYENGLLQKTEPSLKMKRC